MKTNLDGISLEDVRWGVSFNQILYFWQVSINPLDPRPLHIFFSVFPDFFNQMAILFYFLFNLRFVIVLL